MNSKWDWLKKLGLVLCFGFWLVVLVSLVYWKTHLDSMNIGVRVVKLMYEFSSPGELMENQLQVEALLTPEEWERLQLDDLGRVANTYYKFQYSPTKVNIQGYTDGCVIYTLTNDFIDADQLWVFEYDVDKETNQLCNIKEYRLVETAKGGYKD